MERKSNKTKKVAIFIRWLMMGGVQRWAVNLSSGLADRGYEVDLVLANAVGPLLEEVDQRVNVIDLKSNYLVLSLPKLINYINQHKPSILLSAQPFTNTLAIWGQRFAKTRSPVVICEQVRVQSVFRDKGWIGRLFYPWAQAIVAISKGVADDLVKVMHLPREKIRVIYNPIVGSNFQVRADEPIQMPWADGRNHALILSVGRLVDQKDYRTLVNAFSIVVKHRAARLLILGEGECRCELEVQLRKLNLEGLAYLPGFIQNPYPYMKAADIFVLSSKYEGLANVLVEALANGTSVVSTDCAHGPRDVLQDGEYGHLVPVGDPTILASAILETLDHPISPQRLKDRSNDFAITHITNQYIALIESLVY